MSEIITGITIDDLYEAEVFDLPLCCCLDDGDGHDDECCMSIGKTC